MVITFVKIMGWRVDVDDDALEGEADSSKSQSWQLLIVREGACGIGGYTYAHSGYLTMLIIDTLDACYPVFPLRPAWVRTWRLHWRWLAPCFFWDWTYRWFSNDDWIPSARQLVICVFRNLMRSLYIDNILLHYIYIYIFTCCVCVLKRRTIQWRCPMQRWGFQDGSSTQTFQRRLLGDAAPILGPKFPKSKSGSLH